MRGTEEGVQQRPAFIALVGPPGVKIVADCRAEAAADGRSRLVTETRVIALDGISRVLFRLYWIVVGPFSALIRRRWLRAIAARVAARA